MSENGIYVPHKGGRTSTQSKRHSSKLILTIACMSIAVVRLQLDYVEKHLDRYQMWNLGGPTGKILRPSSVALKSKNQEINRLQLAVKLPWAIFFESVDILS
ncbi:hypothetical protein TNCV_2774271 [Trichonephila clavipes]|nr:hypothetical protein TNCV_2774271 [Trichonephila clavipes]